MTSRGANHTIRREHGQIITSWLIKILVIGAIVGFLVLEFGAVLINRLQVGDIAGQAAVESGFVYSNRRDARAAENRAEQIVEENSAEFVNWSFNTTTNEISVTASKTANTRVIHRFEFFERMIEVEVTETAPLRR